MSFCKAVTNRKGFLAIILFSLAFLLIISGSFALPKKIDSLSIKITSSKLEYLKRLRSERGKIHVIPLNKRTAWQKSRMKDLQRAIGIVFRQVGGLEKLAPKLEYLKRLRAERDKIHVIHVSKRTAWQKSRMKDLQRAIKIVSDEFQVSITNHKSRRKKPKDKIIPAPKPAPEPDPTPILTPPSAPLIGIAQALSSSSVRFNYIDTANDEVGFKLHDQNNITRATNSTALLGTGLSGYLDATSLSVNTQYTGHVHAYNSTGDSLPSGNASVYTLANTPSSPTASSTTTSSLKVVVGQNSNPANTIYAIYNNTASKYVQADGGLGSSEVYQTYSAWGGSNGITNTGLSENTSYTYKVKAKNGDGITTASSANSSAVLTLSSPTPPPPPLPSSTMADRIGFAVGNHLVSKGDAELASQLDGMAAIGVKWIRHDMQWSSIQASGPTSYNWAPYDRLISEANKRNIKVLPILTYTPSWARVSSASGSMFAQPANNAQFATFAAAAANRYAPMGIHAYEIWNEPNIPAFWQPAPNVAAYTDLLKKAYVAIKQADPSATVVSGGLSPAVTQNGRISPRDFLTGMYANGVKGYFDKLGHHPYTFPALPSSYYEWSAWSQMNDTNPSLRSIMASNGDSKPIWGTEFGAPTDGMSGVSEPLQAQTIEAAASLMQDRPWLEKLFIYSWKDIGTSTSTIENFFGVVRYDGTYKPGYYSVKNILSN